MRKMILALFAIAAFVAGPALADGIVVVQPGLGGTGNALQTTLDGTTTKAYVQSNEPADETTFNVDFRINTGVTAQLTHNRFVDIVRAFGTAGHHYRFVVQYKDPPKDNYKMLVLSRDDTDGKYKQAGKITLVPNTDNLIRVEWVASSPGPGAGDGEVRIYKNGNLKHTQTNLNNDWVISFLRFGSPNGSAGTGATGTTMLLDEYVSTR